MKKVIRISLTSIFALIIVVVLFYSFVGKAIVVHPGKVGVVVSNKTGIDSTILDAGTHTISRNKKAILLSTLDTKQEFILDVELKSKDISTVEVETRFNLNKNAAVEIMQIYGQNYLERYIIPTIRTTIRRIAVDYNPSEFKKDTLSTRLYKELELDQEFARLFRFNSVYVRSISNPETIDAALTAGLQEENELLSSPDQEIRKEALKKLIDLNTKESLQLVMEHWEKESNKDVREYILEQIVKAK